MERTETYGQYIPKEGKLQVSYQDVVINTGSVLIDAALMIARTIADSKGKFYSQPLRFGANSYDCSSFCYRVWQQCYDNNKELWQEEKINMGVIDYSRKHLLGNTSTMYLKEAFLACGFMQLDIELTRGRNPSGLQAGDIVLFRDPHENAHVSMIYGRDASNNLYVVEAGMGVELGPSRHNYIGFGKYYDAHWQYAFRCTRGFGDPKKTINRYLVGQYLRKLYRVLLNRDPDERGYQDHMAEMFDEQKGQVSENISAFRKIRDFMMSPEYRSIKYTNEQIVTQLYQLILNRRPDPIGFNAQLGVLEWDEADHYPIPIGDTVYGADNRAALLWLMVNNVDVNTPNNLITKIYGIPIMLVNDQNNADLVRHETTVMTPMYSSSKTILYIKINGEWKAGEVYIKVNNTWKKGSQVFAKTETGTGEISAPTWKGGVWKGG